MEKSFIEKAKNIISDTHEALQVEINANIRRAKSNSEFAKLNARKRELLLELGKSLGDTSKAEQISAELKDITSKQTKVLKALGLTFNDLKEKYNCNKCNDTGMIGTDRCECLKRVISSLLLKECGINKSDLPKFSDVDYSLYSDDYVKNIGLIFSNMEHYVNNLSSQNKHIVTISGPAGVGKTFLTECVVERAIEHGYYTLYSTANGLNRMFIDYHSAKIQDKSSIMEPYLKCDLLIIDDLGTESLYNNVTIEYLYLVISERLKDGLYTLINTNLSPNQIIDIYGERIFSRIANINNCMLLDMTANDIRLGLRK